MRTAVDHQVSRREFLKSTRAFFLKTLGIFASAAMFKELSVAEALSARRGKNNELVIALGEHLELKEVGGFKTFKMGRTPIILFRDKEDSFRAVSLVCTHRGCTVKWVSRSETFDCPCHGSQYDRYGRVTGGPAGRDLALFKTEYSPKTNEVIIQG